MAGGLVYIREELYNKIIRHGFDPKDFVNQVVEEALKRLDKPKRR